MSDVAKQCPGKLQTCNTPLVNGMTAAFHKNKFATFINHLFQQCIYAYCIRSGMCCSNYCIANLILHSTNEATLITQGCKQFP